MAKNRTLNEIRQSKEYQLAKNIADANNKNPNITTSNPFSHADVDQTVEVIVENLKNEIYDLIFQAVCDEMNQFPTFDSSEYLTEAGLELFEDEWFEFYHEHHGNIIHQVIKDLK